MKRQILILVAVITIVSCNTTYKIQSYRYVPRANENEGITTNVTSRFIHIENDSVISYAERWGGIGSVWSMKYKIDNGILTLDSLSSDGYYDPDISNMSFAYNRDSLVNTTTNELYYEVRFLDKYTKVNKLKISKLFEETTGMSMREYKKYMKNR